MLENEPIASQKSSYKTDLQDFKNINNSLMQDALRIWSDLWAELDFSRDPELGPRRAGVVPPSKWGQDARDTPSHEARALVPEPSCGFSEFVKKMWILRSYLDFAKRISR